MQAADKPAVLPLLIVGSRSQSFPVALDFRERKQGGAVGVINDGGDIVIEEHPFAVAVSAALEIHLEGIVPGDADGAAAVMAEERFHLGAPLGMRGAAQAEA